MLVKYRNASQGLTWTTHEFAGLSQVSSQYWGIKILRVLLISSKTFQDPQCYYDITNIHDSGEYLVFQASSCNSKS